jgi:hypothetical protein
MPNFYFSQDKLFQAIAHNTLCQGGRSVWGFSLPQQCAHPLASLHRRQIGFDF